MTFKAPTPFKLKSCPFCRIGEGRVNELYETDPYFALICDYCEAEGPPRPTANESALAWNYRETEC